MCKYLSLVRTLFICFFAFSSSAAFCQTIDLQIDSVKTILCKKWEVSYAIVGNTKMGRLPDATEINYEFFQDGSLMMTSDDLTEKTKGTWRYDPKRKSIAITVNKRSVGEVTALKQQEFTMKMKGDKGSPEDMAISLIYRPKTNTSASSAKKAIKPGTVQIKNLGLSDPNSITVYVGKENMVEIEGAEDKLSFSVIGAGTTMRKAAETKVILLPSKEGTVFFTVTQNGKIIATKQFSAILSSK